MEVFGRGHIVKESHRTRAALNCRGRAPMACRTIRLDETPWNFDLKQHRDEARSMVLAGKPVWILGCQPCNPGCSLNVSLNVPSTDPALLADRLCRGRRRPRFVLERDDHHNKSVRYLIHEHPSGALSWRDHVLMRMKQVWN